MSISANRLTVGAFVVTVDGTLVIGLLRQIARSLSASPAAAGQAVTLFAIAYALGVPLLIRATRQQEERRLLIAALAIFAVANAATAAAPSLVALLAARVLAAGGAGVFMATAAAAAARNAVREHRGRALATIVGGASAATALGVPLGTFLGGALGWRTIFYAIAVLTALIALGVSRLPSKPVVARPPSPTFRRADVLLTLATTLLWATGSFTSAVRPQSRPAQQRSPATGSAPGRSHRRNRIACSQAAATTDFSWASFGMSWRRAARPHNEQ